MSQNQPTINELRAIVDWVNLTDDVTDLSLKFGDVELAISRKGQSSNGHAVNGHSSNGHGAAQPQPVAASPATTEPETAPEASVAPATQAAPAQPEASTGDAVAADEVVIKAPMVGTFYAAPKPGDPPFVSVGDEVEEDSVLAIVEVMKLMNNIQAKVKGTVTQILVENEQAVEYGQPMMVIKRHG